MKLAIALVTTLLLAPPAALSNRDADPGATKNLHAERPDLVKELKAQLEQSKASDRSSPKS